MPLLPFVQRPSDDFVHRFRTVYIGNVTDAAAVSIPAAPPQSGYSPMMM